MKHAIFSMMAVLGLRVARRPARVGRSRRAGPGRAGPGRALAKKKPAAQQGSRPCNEERQLRLLKLVINADGCRCGDFTVSNHTGYFNGTNVILRAWSKKISEAGIFSTFA